MSKAENCHWYYCGVGLTMCRRMKAGGRRLYCRECGLTGPPLVRPPAKDPFAEMNLNLGDWPTSKAGPVEVNMEQPTEQSAPAAPETIGQAIARLRTAKGLSKAALAARLRMAAITLGKWENGQSVPRLSSLETLDEYFGGDLARRFGSSPAKECSKTAAPAAVEQPDEIPADNYNLSASDEPPVQAEQAGADDVDDFIRSGCRASVTVGPGNGGSGSARPMPSRVSNTKPFPAIDVPPSPIPNCASCAGCRLAADLAGAVSRLTAMLVKANSMIDLLASAKS